MSEFKFEPSDFYPISIDIGGIVSRRVVDLEDIAPMANAKLAEWLASGVKVYGFLDDKKAEGFGTRMEIHSPTHEAILINIREIKPVECKHEPFAVTTNLNFSDLHYKCKKCGKRLVAKWELMRE